MRELLLVLLALPIAVLAVLSDRLAEFQPPAPSALQPVVAPLPLPQPPAVPVAGIPTGQGVVSDAERFSLAVAAGFAGEDAILAVALSIAEDGSGSPSALSAPNFDGSRDLGLLQINSGWWSQFGGADALTDPLTNFRAGFVIRARQGWCAWSTYLASCGKGHNSAFQAYLPRARAAAGSQP